MTLLRTLPARTARGCLRPGQLQRAGRRSYASAQGAAEQAKQKVGSDTPWLIGSVVAAIVPTVLIVRGGDLKNPFSYPRPGSHYHGEHGDDEHGEEHGDDEEKGEEQDEPEAKSDDAESEDSKADSKSDDKAEDKSGEDKGEQDKDDGDFVEVEAGSDDESRKLKKPDAKGGVKRRIESPNAIKQGTKEGDDDKSAVAGGVSKQQAGISNTDTKHSIDLMQSEHSKKPEGAPDTAKITGTVDPSRGKPKA